jgi:tetratricopeptide (TPR) repeat protein
MERACPSCGTATGEQQLTHCPTCSAELPAARSDDDLFGDLGSSEFIPLPGQQSTSGSDDDLDFDDLFGEPSAVDLQEPEPTLVISADYDGDQPVPLPGASSSPPSDGDLDLDGFFDDEDDDALIALPGSSDGAALEDEDLDSLFGESASPSTPVSLQAETVTEYELPAEPVALVDEDGAPDAVAFEDPLAGLLDDPAPPEIVETEVAGGEDDYDFSLDASEDPLLDVLGGELEEFLQEPEQAMYHLRMTTGDVVGPYMSDRVENMLRTGMLLGNEEISPDGMSWQPLAAHADFTAFVEADSFARVLEDDGPAFDTSGTDQERLPELVGVQVSVVGDSKSVEVTTSEFSDEPRRGGRKKLLVGVAIFVVVVGLGAWQLGGMTTSGDNGEDYSSAPRSRAGVATTSSRFSRINDVLKEDRVAALMKRSTLLRNAVAKSSNQDLEARVALARIACDLNIRFDLPLERMKMVGALKGMTEEMIRGNAFDIARACRSLADRNEGQMEVYLARHIKAKDVEALQLGILVAATTKDKALLEQRTEMALEAGGPGYVERTHFTAARAFERMGALEEARKAYAKVTDGDSTRADAWLGQSRVAWDLIKEIDPRELNEEQLEPIEATLAQARRQIDSLGRHKLWKAEIYRLLGEIQLRRSDFGAAAKFLEKARTFLPRDTKLVERVARVLRLGGDFNGSMATWETLLSMAPNSESGIVGLTDVYIQTAAYERGASSIRSFIAKQTKPSAASIFWHAELLWLMGERKQAREMYKKVLLTDSQFVRALVAMARIDIQDGNLDVATRRLQKARSIDSDNAWVYIGFGDFYRTQDNYELAEREYREAIRRAGKEPRAHYLLAKALLKQGRVEDAFQSASTALSIEERNPKYMVQKASILDELKRHDEAVSLMKRAIRLMPEEDGFYVQLALTLIKRGRVDEARKYLVTAAGINRKNGNIPYLLGVTFVEKQPEKGLGYLRTADQLRPKHGPTLLSMGEAYYRANQSLDAINALTESIQADSSSAEAREWRARAYRDQGQYPEALLDIDHALRIRGAKAGLFYDKAEVYRRWGGKEQTRNALRAYRQAVRSDRSMGKAYCRIAELQIDRNRFRQALRAAKRCVQYEKTSGSGYLSLGMLQKEAGNYNEAETSLSEGLQVDPRGEFAERTQAELDSLLRYR